MNKKLAKLTLLSALGLSFVATSCGAQVIVQFEDLRNIKHDMSIVDRNTYTQPLVFVRNTTGNFTFTPHSCGKPCSERAEIWDKNAKGATHVLTIYYDLDRLGNITAINYDPYDPYVTSVPGKFFVVIKGDGYKYNS